MKRFFLIKYVLAGSGKGHETALRRLSKHKDETIRRRVAENSLCPIEVLDLLAHDESTDVRIAVALNKTAKKQIHAELCKDPSPDVRFMIASASYMPNFLLRLLASDENPYVQARANRTIELKQAAKRRLSHEGN